MRHALIIAVILTACADDPPSGPQVTSNVDYHEFPANHPPALDLLLVIDNTTSMAPYQSQLAQLPSILDGVVANAYDGFPDVHLAVTSNGGALSQVLSDTAHWDGTHTTSFDGSLADVLAPLVAVGASNTGPAQPLAAMRTALEASQDFARPYGYLGIVTISAADDGSPAFDYASWLKSTKSDPANVIVSGIYTQPSAVLDAFHNSFPNRSTSTSIDTTDYTPAFALFGQLYRVVLGYPCWDLPLDIDPETPGDQYDCDVSAWDDNGLELVRLPACDGADPASGTCWQYTSAASGCPSGTGRFDLRGTWSRFHPELRVQCVTK